MSWQYLHCGDVPLRLHQKAGVRLVSNFISRHPATEIGMAQPRPVERAAHASALMAASTGRHELELEALSTGVIAYAQKIVDDWRATGLEVNLVEYFTPERGIDGYALTACSPEKVLCCVCRCWRAAARFRHGPSVWTIEVLVSSSGRMEEGNAGQEPAQRAGLAVAATHEEVWRQVQDWQQGKLLLQTDTSTMPASALLVPRSASFVRPRKVAGLAVITAAVGTMPMPAMSASSSSPPWLGPRPGGWREPMPSCYLRDLHGHDLRTRSELATE
jgi:hypothetical protein